MCWLTTKEAIQRIGTIDIEDLRIEEPKEKEHEDSKKESPLKDLQRKEDQYEDLPKTWKFVKDHPIDQVIGDPIQGVRTRWALKDTCENTAYFSQMSLKTSNKLNMKKVIFWPCKKK